MASLVLMAYTDLSVCIAAPGLTDDNKNFKIYEELGKILHNTYIYVV